MAHEIRKKTVTPNLRHLRGIYIGEEGKLIVAAPSSQMEQKAQHHSALRTVGRCRLGGK